MSDYFNRQTSKKVLIEIEVEDYHTNEEVVEYVAKLFNEHNDEIDAYEVFGTGDRGTALSYKIGE